MIFHQHWLLNIVAKLGTTFIIRMRCHKVVPLKIYTWTLFRECKFIVKYWHFVDGFMCPRNTTCLGNRDNLDDEKVKKNIK